jgi:hypothetical protein
MKFFAEGTCQANEYLDAIAFMQHEAERNYKRKEKMKILALAGMLLLIITVVFVFLRAGPWSYAALLISIAIIYTAFKKWQVCRMQMCFSLYSYDLLKKEYLELFEIKK